MTLDSLLSAAIAATRDKATRQWLSAFAKTANKRAARPRKPKRREVVPADIAALLE